MTTLRSCYRSQFRLFRDAPDVLTWGRWHFCQPGAGVVPYFHLFGSSNWDWDGRFDPPLGEVGTGPRPWFNGKPIPRVKGTNTCGTREQWEEGSLLSARGTMPVAVDGVPLCCIADPLPPGGDADDGEAVQGWGILLPAAGGDSDDGQAEQFGDGYQEAGGGDSDDGQAEQFGDGYQEAGGGDSDDGEASQALGFFQDAGGGDSDDGSAGQAFPGYQQAGGGDSDDGEAVQEFGGGTQTFCGVTGVGFTLYVHMTASGPCAALNGVAITCPWDSATGTYIGSASYSGGTINAKVSCSGTSSSLHLGCNTSPTVAGTGTASGPPYSLSLGSLLVMSCCFGMMSAVINETP
jgi:hypothetical protein